MFNSIIRYYNLNRRKIWTFIIVAIVVIVMIRGLNKIAADSQPSNIQTVNETTTRRNDTSSKSPNVLQTDVSTGGTKIEEEVAKKSQELVNSFISYCNNNDIASAYNLLSDGCKKELFNTQNDFKQKYYDKIFTSKKDYNIEAWKYTGIGVTYRVTFLNDILSTGNIGNSIEDYITVDTDNKINVLRYVATITENKKGSNNVATVEVIDRTIYDEYEIFNIKVTNNSSNTIMINRKEDNDGIYATYSGSNLNYTAFTSEIYENSLTIEPNQTKYLSVRIDKLYNEYTKVKKLVFSDIINNKKTFDSTETKSLYSDISSLEVNFIN